MSLATSTSVPTILFVVFAAVSLTGCGLTSAFDDDTTRRIEDHEIPADGIRRVAVDTDNGGIEIRGGAGDAITIRSVLREQGNGDAEATVRVDDDRLVVTGECDARWWNHCSVGFVVTVPPEVDVRVATDNGRVGASGLTGDVSIETDNGAIEATGLGGGATVVTETDNGRIDLAFAEAPDSVEADTDNGAITVRLPDDGSRYAVDAHTDNGDVAIDVGTDPEAGRPIDLRSDNGAIDIGYRAP